MAIEHHGLLRALPRAANAGTAARVMAICQSWQVTENLNQFTL